MIAPVHSSTHGQTNSPSSLAPLAPINKQEDRAIATAYNNAPTVCAAEALAEVANKADHIPPAAPPRAAQDRGRLRTASPTAGHVAQATRPLSRSKKPLVHRARKPQHRVSDRASMPQHNLQQTGQTGTTPPATSVGPSERTTPLAQPLQRVAHLSPTEAKPDTDTVVHQPLSCATLPSAATQRYPSAQGHQVCFQEEEGKWQAQVEDGWGRVQRLSVLCAPNQTPTRAIQQLASKALGQYKYWVHILETDQPPWAPRVVYVGALGLRGGGWTCAYGHSVRARDSSSDEDNAYEVHIGPHRLYRNTAGNWDNSRYWVRSDHALPAFSANDVRAAIWHFHDCTAMSNRGDCLYPRISYDRMMKLREERREERRIRREAQRKRQEEQRQRQEAARRQEEEHQRQEAARRQEERRARLDETHRREERRRQEATRRQEEAAAKIIVGRRALIQKMDTEAAKTAKKDLDQFWSESTVIAKQQAQMEKALKCLSTTKADKQTHAQKYVGTPYLRGDAMLKASKPDDRSDDSSDADTNHDRKPKAAPQATIATHKKVRKEPFNIPINYKGLPNVGNTCYLNAGLQVIARLYPNLFSHKQDNTIVRDGKTIIDKLTHQDATERVTIAESIAFRDALIRSYNVGKGAGDQLRKNEQEDAAPVWNFLLAQGKATKVALYRTKVHPEGRYATTINDQPDTGPTLVLPLPSELVAASMDQLVADTLHGERVADVIWEHPEGKQETRGDALVGDRLSMANLHGLNNRILPIWVHRFGQTDNTDAGSAEKIKTSITNPFSLTIPAEHLIEKVPYTGRLVGFIHHEGALHGGHYTAYLQHSSGAWVCYDDTSVTTLDSSPLLEAQAAYLYFYKAVNSTAEEVLTAKAASHQLQRQEHTDALSHLYDTSSDTAYVPTQANNQKPSRRTTTQRPIVVEDVIETEAQDNETDHNIQPENPATAVQDQKLKQTLQKSRARLAKAKEQLETTREQWIRKQVVVMAHTLDHQPLLHFLAGEGRKYINEKDDQGKTALQHAIARHQLDVVQWLLDHGADGNAKSKQGSTPLRIAAEKGHTATAAVLLDRDAAIEAKDNRVSTPLHRAAQQGHTTTVALLLDRGADIAAKDRWGSTPLHYAAVQGHLDTVELLLAHGADIEARDKNKYTPLQQAARKGHTDIVTLLLHAKKVDIEAEYKNERAVWPEAASRLQIDSRRSQDSRSESSVSSSNDSIDSDELASRVVVTPAYKPFEVSDDESSHGIDSRGSQGSRSGSSVNSELSSVEIRRKKALEDLRKIVHKEPISTNDSGSVERLLARGAAIEERDEDGKTPLDIAISNDHKEVATLLRAAQAPGWKRRSPAATVPPVVVEDVTDAENYEPTVENEAGHNAQCVTPVTQPSVVSTPPTNVKDAPELARAKGALKSAQEAYEVAQQKLENEKSAHQEAQDAVAQAKTALTLAHTLGHETDSVPTTQEYVSQKNDSSTVSSSVPEGTSAINEIFADTYTGTATPSDTKDDFKAIGEQSPLADATWDWNQAQEILTNALIDNLTFSTNNTPTIPNDTEATHQQTEISEGATTPPITTQEKATSPGVSPRSVFYALPSFSRVAKAVTIPFDDRPLAPLVQEVNRVCLQLNNCALCTEQLNTLLREGRQLMRSCQQQPYASTLDWQERIQYKTLVDKLSCHVRLYQRLAHWTKDFTEEELQAFETVIAPTLKQRFLRASTEIQQDLLNYWEHHGTCYADLLLEAPVQDWLKVSLYHDIVLAGLVNDDSLIQEQFMQEAERLVQHREGPTQQKLLTQLLWALRARQQAHQLDLLALYKLMAWLPNEGEQALRLLNNEAHDWYKTLKARWMRTQLAVFENRFQADAVTALCDALVQLPWDHTRTDFFLRAVEQEQNPTAFKNLLRFLANYSIEDSTLLDVFYTEFPEDAAGPCHFIHHTLACKLLKTPMQLFGQHTEALHGQITTWLNTSLGAFDALYAFLTALKNANTNASVHSKQALQLREVLTLLNDYGTTATVGTQTFQKLTSQPLHQWEATTHQLVIDATFRTSRELNVEELIQEIAENAPGVHFAGDAQQLQRSYDAVTTAYQGPSAVLQAALMPAAEDNEESKEEEKERRRQYLAEAQQPIASWPAATITRWSALVKEKPEQVSQRELLAVIKRAVALHHGFTPRAIQLLSVLMLLNTPEKTGRLAQIYTGEGKSLIVAMLAAIHALQGQKVDVLTTSTELSIPEVKKQKPFFGILGLTIGENSKKNAIDDEARHAIYQKDIVYGTAEDFQADIISTDFFRRDIRGSRGFGVVLVDEVDSMLYDGRNYSIQLSSLTPAMNHLEIVLGSIWNYVNRIASRLRTIEGQCYFIKAKEFQDIPGGGVVLPAGQTLAECSRPVDDQMGFLQQNTTTLIEQLIRKLTPEERENLAAYKAQERRVQDLSEKVQEEESIIESASPNWSGLHQAKKGLEYLKKQYEAALETLKQLPWYQAEDYLEIPAHLQDFARLQIAYWIKSAIHALLYYQKDRHYCVDKGGIVAIDYSNTGVLQYNTVWENGLHQFLQIKEGLKVKPEGISTNFCSKPGYFQYYEHRIYGLTGTLGNETTRRFLASVYGVDMVHVPSYKQREITGNETSHYRCKELNPYLLATSTDWYKAIRESALRPARNGQAVLVLCKHVDQVLPLKEELAKQYDADKLFTYTGKSQFEKHQVDSGEIIIATNIAGRGTDLTTSQAVEDKGGLHVCISFLPDSYRVELQNAGRTARQGKKGSAQLVLRTTGDETLETLHTQRDKDEAKAIEQAEQDVERMIAADRLFMRYCGVEESFFPAMEALRKANLSQQLSAQWEVYVEQTQSADNSQAAYEEYIQKRLKVVFAKHEEELRERDEAVTQTMQGAAYYTEAASQAEHEALVQNLTAALKKETPLAAFCKEREMQMRIAFVRTLQTQKEIPADVFAAFVEGQVYVPSTSIGTSPTSIGTSHIQQIIQKATGWGWTEHERHGSQERWGLWLKGDKTEEDQALAARQQRFDGFAKALKEDASKNQLIKNPYYFVRKGNELLQDRSLSAAIMAYNRAIDLDPPYSVNARYNKARALMSYEENKDDHTVIKKELKEAQELIGQQQIVLLGFDTLVGKTGKKPGTSEHVQHQLDVLNQQKNYIQAAIDVVEQAQEKDWDVEITEIQSIKEVFKDAEGDRTEALREATANGFTHVFTIKEKEPTNWWGIISVALIGLTQIAAGVFINVCTLGVGSTWGNALISEGVSDFITAVQASIQGGYFSWASWALQKAISLAITLASAGIEKMKQLFQGPQKATGKAATEVAKQQTEAQIRKKCLDTSIKRVGTELGKGFAKECVNALVDYGVDELLMKNIEKEIAERVSKKVTQSLGENKWVQAALALDVKNENNYWQNRLLQEGMALLAEKKDSKVLYALKEVAKGVASNTIPGAQAAMRSAAMIKALNEVMKMTDSFLAELHGKIANYEGEIKKAQEKRQEVEKQQQQEETEQHQENQQVSAPPPPVDEEDLEVPIIAFQENYKSDLRSFYHDNRPSDVKNLCGSFSSAITSRIANKIQGDIVRPATGPLVNMGIDKMLEGVEKSVQKDEEDCRISGAPIYYAKKMANEKLKKDKKNKQGSDRTERTQEGKASSDNKQPSAGDAEHDTKSAKPGNKTIAERIRNGAPVTYLEIAALAAELGRPVIVRDEQNGDRLLTVGSKQKGKPIEMGYIPAIGGGVGHIVHPDKPDSAIPTSGLNNCMFDVAASQTGLDGVDLRERVANRAAQSKYTQKLHRATETLRAYKPGAMIEGGHGMDTTIYDPIVIEKLWNKKRNEGDPVDYSTYFLNYQKTNLDAQLDVLTGFVKTGAMVGTGIAVTTATAGAGTPAVLSYLAGTGAVSGVSMALDPKVRHSLATGDWVGAMAHGSYHTPFIGNGRNTWEAWQMGKPWSAAGHAGLFSVEALGMRSAGRVRGVVRGGGKASPGVAKRGGVKVGKQAEKKVSGKKGAVERSSGEIGKQLVKVGDYTYTDTAARHITDVVKKAGWYNGKLSRPYMNSPQTINEIISTGKGVPDAYAKGAFRYDVSGVFQDKKGVWELVVDPKNKTIFHFLFNPCK